MRLPFAGIALALVVLATLLRMWHIGHGLPDLNEEAFSFRRALALWGADGDRVDLNPHWFAYPSLTIYIQLLVQQAYFASRAFSTRADFLLALATDPSGAVILGRSVGVLADIITLWIVGRIARRHGDVPAVLAMVLVGFAPTMIHTSRLIYTDSVMCALSIAAIDRMLAYRDRGGTKLLAIGSGLIGLAAGAKYPAILLLVPMAIAIAQRNPGPSALARVGTSIGIAALAFLCTTPYVLVSGSEFVRDAVFIGDASTAGQLGKLGGTAFTYYLAAEARNLGWLGLVLVASSLVSSFRRTEPAASRLLWVCWLVLFLPIAAVPVEADRYLVPALAVSAVLVAAGAPPLLAWLRRTVGRFAGAILIVSCSAQPAWLGLMAAMAGRTATQLEARKWCESHLQAQDLLLSEAYGPNLLTYGQRADLMASPVFGAASEARRKAYESRRAFYLVYLPLIVGGNASVRLPVTGAPEMNVFPHATDWNEAVYDLRVLRGVDYVVTTSVVRGRFERDSLRYGEQRRFYAFLDRYALPVARFAPDLQSEGPTITIHRLTSRARKIVLGAGLLDTLWWARTVPASFRIRVVRILRGESPDPSSDLPVWAQALRQAYAQRYAPFAGELAQNLVAVGQPSAAEDVAIASLAVLPEDPLMAQVYAYLAGQRGDWAAVERVLDRSVAALGGKRSAPPALLLARADALIRIGARAPAEDLLIELVRRGDPATAPAARVRLVRLRGQRP